MKTKVFKELIDQSIKRMGYDPDDVHISKMKLADKTVVNEDGKLEDVMFMDVFVQPKKEVEYIEFDINLTENGIKEI